MIKDPETLTGVVLHGAHGIYDVHTDHGILRCTLRGKLKKSFAQARSAKLTGKASLYKDKSYASRYQRNGLETPLPQRLTVGDYVKLRQLDNKTGLIEEILPRQSALLRKDANTDAKRPTAQTMLANLDQVVIVFATTRPEPHFGMLDRYLAICESARIRPIICLNKVDLPHDERVEKAADLYSHLGYTVIWTSPKTGTGIDTLRTLLKEHTTLFTGPSGAGKSSLVNAIEPGMALKTGLVSDATGKGRHTTTSSQLYPLSEGGWLADSAGIRALATWDIAPEDLGWCFVEFRPFLDQCLYSDCLHVDEEGCAVRQAVEDGLINEERYTSYVRMVTGEER
ncbi:MAG TPA: ribosome small subunit-dependent GTPase A [Ktedonobacteraceae bacterium]|nr:ribosome small subunit-dependent GTPase A [Ktedonobacteraceae bacterium]